MKYSMEDKLKEMQEDIAPANMDEFRMGMLFSVALDYLRNPDVYGPATVAKMLVDGDDALDYWFGKYDDMIRVSGDQDETG